MPALYYTLIREDEAIHLILDYDVADIDPGVPPSLDYPGEPPSGGGIERLDVTRSDDDTPFVLTAEEVAEAEAYIYEHHDYAEACDDSDEWGSE